MILYLRKLVTSMKNIIPIYSFLSTIQANDPFHALYLSLSPVDTDLRVNAKGIYLITSHLPSSKEKKKTEKPQDYVICAVPFEMKDR